MFGKKIRIGFDLGSFGLKIAAREARSDHCFVWSGELFPERDSREQEIDFRFLGARLGDLIAEAQKQLPYFNRTVVASVAGDGVFYGYLDLPSLSAKELQVAVTSSLTREVPLPLEEVEVASMQVPPLDGSPKKTGIFYCAMKKKRIERLTKLLDHVDLSVHELKPLPMALAAEYAVNRKPVKDELVCLLNVGFERTILVILKGGFPYYARAIELAGRDFTYAFQMASQITWERAEEFKRDYHITERDFMLEPFLVDWSRQIERSIKYFCRTHDQETPREMFLSGGSAAWSGLARYLEQAIGGKVNVDGWSHLSEGENPSGEAGASALHKGSIGLSLTSAEVQSWQFG